MRCRRASIGATVVTNRPLEREPRVPPGQDEREPVLPSDGSGCRLTTGPVPARDRKPVSSVPGYLALGSPLVPRFPHHADSSSSPANRRACRIDPRAYPRYSDMNPSNSALKKIDWPFTGVILLSMAIGAGSAGAETFQQGGSTTTIEQSGGQGTSHSQVIRDQEGQTIITHDGNSTDITVQHRSDTSSPDDNDEPPPSANDRVDRSWIDDRFSRRAPARGSLDSP